MKPPRDIGVVKVQAESKQAVFTQAAAQASRSAQAGERVLVVYGPNGADIYSEAPGASAPRPPKGASST